jgi:O-antigen biosynthesis protein
VPRHRHHLPDFTGKTDPNEFIVKADDQDKPDPSRRETAAGIDFRPLVVVLPDADQRIDQEWLDSLRARLPGHYRTVAGSTAADLDTIEVDAADLAGLARTATDTANDHGTLLIESGLELPSDIAARLAALARAPDCPPLTIFAGNHDDDANPAAGLDVDPGADWCDDLAHLAGTRQWTLVDHLCRRMTYAASGSAGQLDALIEQRQAWITDTIYVHDPKRSLSAGSMRHPALAAALGPLRLAMTRLAERDELGIHLPRAGRDERPVTLHISHHWGGGVARWIDDVIAGDERGHHLVLAARGHSDGKVHGQRLCLYAAGATRGPVAEWTLSPAIAATDTGHGHYREVLQQVIERHGIGRIIVSSLIGHSLDALRTGLPTLQVLHDYYPAWPVLEQDPLQFDDGDRIDLERALASSRDSLLFERGDPGFWRELARQWLTATREHAVSLIAPTGQVRQRWCRLMGEDLKDIDIVPHGFEGWSDPPTIEPASRPDGRLNLVVVGRLSPGKGLGLLERALPKLRRVAHVTLVGCGHHGMRLFGQPGVDILLDFRREELPDLLATLRPQAALFLSTVAETWNYVLSETRSLGLVPIATRTGSFIERIDHGHDGLLFEPDDESLLACLEELYEQPERLAAMAGHLPTETTLAEAIAACDQHTGALPGHWPEPSIATDRTLQPMARDSELADSLSEQRRLAERNEALYADLVERTAWARKHERLTHERTARLNKALDRIEMQAKEIQERTRWALSMEEALEKSRAHVEQLQHDLDAVHASTSWRLTRPLRFMIRLASNARANRVWNPVGWPRLVRQFRLNLRSRGLRGAIDRMQHLPPPPQAPTEAPSTLPGLGGQPASNPNPVAFKPADQPRASIVIPVFNKYEYTAACLHSIAEHAGEAGFEVIVVDDCSSDETADYLERCQGLTVIRNESNAGFIHSCNAGAAAASSDYLVFLNNDTTVTDGWLEALLGTFETMPDAGVVGARLVYPDGRLQEAGGIIFNDASGWNYGRGDDPDRPQYTFVSEADYVSGACLAIRRQDFEQLQGFDSRYAPAYYEDTDLCFQVRAIGKRVIYQPAATIIHYEGITSGTEETSGTKRYQAVNRDKFRDKWAGVLAEHPAPEPRHDQADPVRHLRFRRSAQRVLLIDAVTPQPDHDSGSVRIMAMMKLLQELGFQVSFMPENMAWVDGYSDALQQAGIEVLCAPRIASLEEWLGEHGPELDLVLVSRYYVLGPIVDLLRRRCRRAQLVFDTVDLHFLREEREAEVTGSEEAAIRAAESRHQELALIGKADTTLVVSAAERELLAELVPDAEVRIVSNIHEVHGCARPWDERKDLMFVGGFQHLPNVDAAKWLVEDIFPLVRSRLPGVRLHLIGSRMPEDILDIDQPGVRIQGFVPDLDPFLEGCRLSLAPLRYGAGVKGKVNQAMSHGLPVVATTCAAEGMFLEHGRDVLIADDARSFADCIVSAYEDETLWNRLSAGGMDNVQRHFSMEAARRALGEAIRQSA